MQLFLEMYGFKNLIAKPTCYENLEERFSIDLILTNRSSSFQCSFVIESGLSHFHKMDCYKTSF